LAVAGCIAPTNDPSGEPAPLAEGDGEPTPPDVAPRALKPRVAATKPTTTVQGPGLHPDHVIVKFKEGTNVRLRSGALVASAATAADAPRLARSRLTPSRVTSDVARANTLLVARPLARTFERAEGDLDRERTEGEARSGDELADLNLYYEVAVADAAEQKSVLDALNALDSVEIAFAPPVAVGAAVDIPPTTWQMKASQTYVEPVDFAFRNGIDARFARTVEGGAGAGVKIIDIEQGWNTTHEDMPSLFVHDTYNATDVESRDHGTAVLGIMGAVDNSYGVTGLASDARIGFVSTKTSESADHNLAQAINSAAAKLAPGDLMLIEQHAPGPDSGEACPCVNNGPHACDQFNFVPMEHWQVYFDAMKSATALGVIVVEAGGNGSMNLDAPRYNHEFDRTHRDSGAILVGAGTSDARAPECFTNFGSRIDVHAWGDSVQTLGYGDTQIAGNDQNQWYTSFFSGTSSATPIVASAIADIQGARYAHGLGPMLPSGMRTLLHDTGTVQGNAPGVTKAIGTQPDLRAALSQVGVKPTERITHTATAGAPGTFVTVLDHRSLNNQPAAVLHVSHSREEGGVYDDHPLAVAFDATLGRWTIVHEDKTPFPAGAVYNVVINGGYVHRATSSTLSFNGYMTYLNNKLANESPDAIVQVTQNLGSSSVFNNHPIAVRYDVTAKRWAIYNQDRTPIPVGASFDVMVSPFGSFSFSTTTTLSGNIVRIDNPATDNNPLFHLLVTRNFAPHQAYDALNLGVSYKGTHWSVFEEGFAPITKHTDLDILVSEPRPTW
jgi:hypothetical protein